MTILNGVIGNHPQPSEFELGGVPYPIATQKVTIDEPAVAMVEDAVRLIFPALPSKVQAIVCLVATELIRNAEWHGRAPGWLAQPAGAAVTLTLGWATSEVDQVKYPLIKVSDRNPQLPEVQASTRTGLRRVISLTHLCGATNASGGIKHVWALVDPQER